MSNREKEMDSGKEESFSISIQQTLLLHKDQASKKTRIKNLKPIIIFTSLILLIIIALSIILPSILKKLRKPDAYVSGSSRFYCHLTPYPQLCYTSMSSTINATALKSNPGPIFSTSLQVAINELNKTTYSITKALSSFSDSDPLFGPSLSECLKLVSDSVSRLNNSLGLLGVDSNMEWLTYVEMDDLRVWTKVASDNVGKCFMGLEEIGGIGVEEVKSGVEIANNLIANSVWLFDRRDLVFYDFYSPLYSDYDYNYYDNYIIGYRFLICLYSGMYVFLAFLYFLFWRSK